MTPVPEIKMLLRTMADVFTYVSVWHDPMMFSWIINGSMEPHDPDLSVIEAHLARPEVANDMESIGITGAFEFVNHYVFSDADLIAWAGEGPLVIDDHTRLDFTVPRSKDAFFGLGNLNTDLYLLEFMDEKRRDAKKVAFDVLARKVGTLARVKMPVLPAIANLDDYRLDAPEVARQLEAARGSLLLDPARKAPRARQGGSAAAAGR